MKAQEVLKILDITRPTLTKYVKDGTISYDSIVKGRYIYNDESVYKLIGQKNKKTKKINVIYSRISNPPKKYVDEQVIRLSNYCINKGIDISDQYTDIASGMNFSRPGFNKLIEKIVKNEIDIIVIENKDRLCRFGFEMFENFIKYYGCKIIIANDSIENKTYEQELTDDLISIIHYFSMKSDSNRRKLNKIRKELEETETSENEIS